jgi:hypothetical protein
MKIALLEAVLQVSLTLEKKNQSSLFLPNSTYCDKLVFGILEAILELWRGQLKRKINSINTWWWDLMIQKQWKWDQVIYYEQDRQSFCIEAAVHKQKGATKWLKRWSDSLVNKGNSKLLLVFWDWLKFDNFPLVMSIASKYAFFFCAQTFWGLQTNGHLT